MNDWNEMLGDFENAFEGLMGQFMSRELLYTPMKELSSLVIKDYSLINSSYLFLVPRLV